MDILAENCTTLTESLFMEGMGRTSAESYGKFAKKAIAFLAAAWLVLAAVTLWQGQNPVFAVVELVVICLAALWIAVLLPRNRAKRAFQTLENKYAGELERVTRFYDDRLELEASGRQLVIFYSEITQVLRSKHLLLLVSKNRIGTMLSLDGFTRGSADAVCKLIEHTKSEEHNDD